MVTVSGVKSYCKWRGVSVRKEDSLSLKNAGENLIKFCKMCLKN